MALKSLGVRYFHAPQDKLATHGERMNVVANANVNHGRTIEGFRRGLKK
jgi:hypothetical protein